MKRPFARRTTRFLGDFLSMVFYHFLPVTGMILQVVIYPILPSAHCWTKSFTKGSMKPNKYWVDLPSKLWAASTSSLWAVSKGLRRWFQEMFFGWEPPYDMRIFLGLVDLPISILLMFMVKLVGKYIYIYTCMWLYINILLDWSYGYDIGKNMSGWKELISKNLL